MWHRRPSASKSSSLRKNWALSCLSGGQRRRRCTPAGEYFARQCQSVLSQYHGAVKQARSIADGKKQDLRLGINGPYTQESIPGYLRQFRQLYPEAAIHLREGGREEILDALFQEELDVIVVP